MNTLANIALILVILQLAAIPLAGTMSLIGRAFGAQGPTASAATRQFIRTSIAGIVFATTLIAAAFVLGSAVVLDGYANARRWVVAH